MWRPTATSSLTSFLLKHQGITRYNLEASTKCASFLLVARRARVWRRDQVLPVFPSTRCSTYYPIPGWRVKSVDQQWENQLSLLQKRISFPGNALFGVVCRWEGDVHLASSSRFMQSFANCGMVIEMVFRAFGCCHIWAVICQIPFTGLRCYSIEVFSEWNHWSCFCLFSNWLFYKLFNYLQ